MTRVDIVPEVEEEFLETVERLASFSKRQANELIEYWESVLNQIRDFPESGQVSRRDPLKRVIRRGKRYRFIYEYRPETGAILLQLLDGRFQRRLP